MSKREILSKQFPFTAVAGQEQFKLALLLAAVNPLVGGVLVSGPRGAAKSTLAKGLADVLPSQDNRTLPFVTLPLGATEEMLIGTLDLDMVLNDKSVQFKPGLLARAHEGVLYVDEVNLLPDNLVDQLLDAAASGINTVERDGVSHQHVANFILLGTMNPDEGELRSQLTDRFGLSVELSNQYSLDERMEIVRLREEFDGNPSDFHTRYANDQKVLCDTIAQAQALLGKVNISNNCRKAIAQRCSEAHVDGLRADIVWGQAAKAKAALAQRTEVTLEDVSAVEAFVLCHRRKDDHTPSQGPKNNTSSGSQSPQLSNTNHQTPSKPFSRPHESESQQAEGDWGALSPPSSAQCQETDALARLSASEQQNTVVRKPESRSFHTSAALSLFKNKRLGNAKGKKSSQLKSASVDWFASLVANAGTWPLETLKHKIQRQGQPVINMVLLDTSGSILMGQGFAKAKGILLKLAHEAYLKREQFVLIGFGGEQVDTLMGLRRASKSIQRFLNGLHASGGTPLSEALDYAVMFQNQQLSKVNPKQQVHFNNYIITDGRVSMLPVHYKLLGQTVVIDVEQSPVKRGRAGQIAEALHASYSPIIT